MFGNSLTITCETVALLSKLDVYKAK